MKIQPRLLLLSLSFPLLAATRGPVNDHTDRPRLTPVGSVLGEALSFLLEDSGSPGDLYAVVPSLQSGPFVLPGGVVAEIGLDLFGLAKIGFLDGAGKAEIVYPLPPTPSLAGVHVRAQGFVAATATAVIEEASEVAARNLRVLNDVFQAPLYLVEVEPPLVPGRYLGRVDNVITKSNGQVLAGGLEPHPTFGLVPSKKIVVINGTKGKLESAGSLLAARAQPFVFPHVGPDGDDSIVIAGGIGSLGQALKSVEHMNLVTGAVTTLPAMNEAHVGGACVTLDDGTTWFYGGANTANFTPATFPLSIHNRIEMFDPATQACLTDPSWFGLARAGHAGAKLNDGRLIFVGGIEGFTGLLSKQAWIFDTASKFWAPVPDLPIPIYAVGIFVDGSGTVHVTGGGTGSTSAIVPNGNLFSWTPGTGAWVTSPGGTARVQPRVAATKNGAIVSGGAGANVVQSSTGISGDPVSAIELLTATGIHPIDDLYGANHSLDVTPIVFLESGFDDPDGPIDDDLIHVVFLDGAQPAEEVSVRVSDHP